MPALLDHYRISPRRAVRHVRLARTRLGPRAQLAPMAKFRLAELRAVAVVNPDSPPIKPRRNVRIANKGRTRPGHRVVYHVRVVSLPTREVLVNATLVHQEHIRMELGRTVRNVRLVRSRTWRVRRNAKGALLGIGKRGKGRLIVISVL